MVKRRRRGHIQLRSNGTFRAYVYAGRDPITKKKRYLSETVQTYDKLRRPLPACSTRSTGSAPPPPV
ncbi:MAG TPA: hypothetical protein VGC06_06525 [Actinomycetes bacterium]